MRSALLALCLLLSGCVTVSDCGTGIKSRVAYVGCDFAVR